ncbi:MAG: hypothetical protein FH748_08190 [Balneolaceae bacterium]|nr:hypothetical protein [Balneolaceae bacterium]
MKYLPKFFATLLVALLIMVNFNMEYRLNPIDMQVSVDLNTVQAEPWEPDMKLMDETCWVNGRAIEICRHYPPWYCDVGAQDACSSQE